MKSLVSMLTAFAVLTPLSVLSACGDDDDTDGTGGAAGMASGGSSSGSGGKASGGASSGGASSGGASSGGASSGGSGGTGGGQGDHVVCADAQALADDHQTDLDCANGTGMIQEECEALLADAPECEDEFEALQACGEDQPAASWVCDEDEETALAEDFCSDEALAVILCAS